MNGKQQYPEENLFSHGNVISLKNYMPDKLGTVRAAKHLHSVVHCSPYLISCVPLIQDWGQFYCLFFAGSSMTSMLKN